MRPCAPPPPPPLYFRHPPPPCASWTQTRLLGSELMERGVEIYIVYMTLFLQLLGSREQ